MQFRVGDEPFVESEKCGQLAGEIVSPALTPLNVVTLPAVSCNDGGSTIEGLEFVIESVESVDSNDGGG